MSIVVREISRHPITSAPNNGVTVTARKEIDATSLGTDVTGADGLAEFTLATLGYPGPLKVEHSLSGTDIKKSGWVTGQVGGLFYEMDLPDIFNALGVGVVPNIGGELAVTAPGGSMTVSVAAGVALVQGGYPYGAIPFVLEAAQNVVIPTASGSNPRIDRIVIRVTREGQTEQGKIVFAVVSGTPAASPSPPALTTSTTTYDFSLAQVLVGTSVSAIAADKVTDERYSTSLEQAFILGRPTGLRASDMLYINSSGKLARLPVSTNGFRLVLAGGLPAWTADIGGATFAFGNGSDLITTSAADGFATIPYAATITRWQIRSINSSATIGFDVDRAPSGSSTYTNIDGTEPPTLTGAQFAEDSALSTWTTSLAARDDLRVSVASSPAIVFSTRIRVYLEWTKT
jgi:hypothetical protein